MDKQKQIEEMAKLIEQAMAKARRTIGGHNNIANFYATMLVNAGYRKIPENAVVLETSVYESLDIKLYRDTITEKVRKETAEKFAERLKQRLKVYLNEDLDFLMKWCECNITIDEIAKEIKEGKL